MKRVRTEQRISGRPLAAPAAFSAPQIASAIDRDPASGPQGFRTRVAFGKIYMAKKMLIDATHAEETRVVVVDGNKVEEFDFETVNKRQIAGNIYLAKITRVEPSLQAAFVDYGGNRHGFLAFSEIHPDYYQIPVADRQALLAEERAYRRGARRRGERRPPASARQAAIQGRKSTPRRRRRDQRRDPRHDRPRPRRRRRGRGAGDTGRRRRGRRCARSRDRTVRRACVRARGALCRRRPCLRHRRGHRIRRRRGCERGNPPDQKAPAAQVQDPGGGQGPADHAGPGGQGRARQQGRGADDLSQPRRPLLRADAEHRPGRRHLAQDHATPRTARSSRKSRTRSRCRKAPA